MDDKEKSAIEKPADTVKDTVGHFAKSAVLPTVEPDTAHLPGTANEQMYIPEATDAPMPAAQFAALGKKKRAAPARASKHEAKAKSSKAAATAKKVPPNDCGPWC
jgi:hypothetical protein